jgi:hypothetical protein
MAQLWQFSLIFILLLAKISLDLLEKNGPGISNIEAKYLVEIDKDSDQGRPCEFCVDFTVEELLVGGLEGQIDHLYKFVLVWKVVEFLESTIKVFS